MDTDTQLPVRVLTNHEAWGIDADGDVICTCGAKHPCDSRKQAAKAQLRTVALITAAMAVDYMRLITIPRLQHAAHRLHDRLFSWIPEAVAQQRAMERAWAATRTGAQRAVARIKAYRENLDLGRITAGSGLKGIPAARGEVRYGDVIDSRGRVVPAGRSRG